MTAAYAPTIDRRPVWRSPWIVIVDAALPVVLLFWAVVDLGTSVVGLLAGQAPRLGRVALSRGPLH